MNEENLFKLGEIVTKIKEDFADVYDVNTSDITLNISATGYLHIYAKNKGKYSVDFYKYLPVAGGEMT